MLAPSRFRPPWWLRGPHAQTVWASSIRRAKCPPLRWESVSLADGDFVELAWVDRTHSPDTPTAMLIHGLGGSVDSTHVRGVLTALDAAGFRAGCFHFRGCGPQPNTTHTGYHSGLTADPRHVLTVLRERHPDAPLSAVGFSLGANVLLKLLGEDGADAVVDRAVAVSPPLVLARCADRMEKGLSRVYQAVLLRKLVAYIERKPTPVDRVALRRVRTFREFDDLVTAPVHGFADAADYYEQASSRRYLGGIRVPTLVVHARDDPFFSPDVIPEAHELPEGLRFEVAERGGHVGFVEGWGRSHLDTRIPQFLTG